MNKFNGLHLITEAVNTSCGYLVQPFLGIIVVDIWLIDPDITI